MVQIIMKGISRSVKEVRVLEIKESVFADNDRQADNLRRELKEQGVFLMNLMSSPDPERLQH